jgi:Ca-activated chloride channel family protein
MKRWHLTLGLAGTALVATLVAPRLQAMLVEPPPPEPGTPSTLPQASTAPVVEQGRLKVHAGLDRNAFLAGETAERFLTITLTAPEDGGRAERAPVNVAVVMDASGSMSAAGKIGYAKDAAKAVVAAMEPGDTFSLVTFNDDARVVIPATDAAERAHLDRQIDRVYEGGGTNLYAGMSLGDREVQRVQDPGEIGRLVVLSDGNANVGVTEPDMLARFASDASAHGVAVSAMGLGVDYNEDLLARIADTGGGTYDYIDDPSELVSVFSQELERTSSVVLRNTRVAITLPPGVVPLDVLGWNAELSGNTWTVFAGDLYAGTQRKIVTRVRVSPNAPSFDVASVSASYVDLADGRHASSHATATARSVTTAAEVAASLDPTLAAAAQRAWGNHHLQLGTEAYASGDLVQAQQHLRSGRQLLVEGAAETGNAALRRDAAEIEAQLDVYTRHAPSSARGRRAIKMNKEIVRGASR